MEDRMRHELLVRLLRGDIGNIEYLTQCQNVRAAAHLQKLQDRAEVLHLLATVFNGKRPE